MAEIEISEACIAAGAPELSRLASGACTEPFETLDCCMLEASHAEPVDSSNLVALKASVRGEDAGIVVAVKKHDCWALDILGVLPGFRGLGAGRKLLDACLDRMTSPPGNVVTPSIDSRNRPAVLLLESVGFRKNDDEVLRMSVELSATELPLDLPEGCSFRTYRPGDEHHWIRLFDLVFRDLLGSFRPWTHEQFRVQFLDRPVFQAERLFFLCQEDRPVGSITAWTGDEEGRAVGIVHWVMLDPELRGKGLGRPMMVQCMNRLREEGWPEAFLTTRANLNMAILLYERMGFKTLYNKASFVKCLE